MSKEWNACPCRKVFRSNTRKPQGKEGTQTAFTLWLSDLLRFKRLKKLLCRIGEVRVVGPCNALTTNSCSYIQNHIPVVFCSSNVGQQTIKSLAKRLVCLSTALNGQLHQVRNFADRISSLVPNAKVQISFLILA